MTVPEFVRSRVVYRILREILSPVLRQGGYRRVPRTQAAWSREYGDDLLTIAFRTSSFGNATIGGNSLDAEVVFNDLGRTKERRTNLSRCLLQAEFDVLYELQAEVNARRPLTSVTVQWLSEASLVGTSTRAAYDPPDPARYREGHYVALDYYSEEDVRAIVRFLARHCITALDRFVTDGCPPPIFIPVPDGIFGADPPAV